jgi:4-amino-4-deoxy-L-arabinose transferase-like glycosyltransferase
MRKWGIILVLLIAAAVRLYALSSVPPAASLDEVSIGYNAFSILKTGRDEYGSVMPFLLRAYDDWRPALYVYLVVPFVAMLGLTTIAVRLPSVLLSLGSIYLVYLLVRELFKKESVALVVSFLFAVSPWHVYLSRLGHEVNLGFAVTTAALWAFVKFVNKPERSMWLHTSGVLFGISLWTYQSQKLIMPVLALVLAFIYSKVLMRHVRTVVIAALLGAVVALPAVISTFSQAGLVRLQGTSAFSGDHPYYIQSVQGYAEAIRDQNVLAQLYYSRKFTHLRVFGANYMAHFAPGWLFTGGVRENHKVPYTGLLYLIEVPFVLWGLWALRTSQPARGLLALLLISPLPAAITTQAPHAMRAFTMLAALEILAAYGFITLVKRFNWVWLAILPLTFAIVVAGRNYFVTFPQAQSDSFQYALHNALGYALARENEVAKVVVSNEGSAYQSYMFYLFERRYDPARYLALGGTVSGGYAQPHAIGTWEFRPINWEEDGQVPGVLFLGNPSDFPHVAVVASFYNLDGSVGVVAARTL